MSSVFDKWMLYDEGFKQKLLVVLTHLHWRIHSRLNLHNQNAVGKSMAPDRSKNVTRT